MTYRRIRTTELIAPPFYSVYNAVMNHEYTHYTMMGGRAGTKSDAAITMSITLLLQNPNIHAVVMRKVGRTLKNSVFSAYLKVISRMGIDHLFKVRTSPLEIEHKYTKQKILFIGVDEPEKLKSFAVPFGYVAVTHFEEKDQFAGEEEVAHILRSTMRGGDDFWNFETFNPPASPHNWANIEVSQHRDDRLVHKSDYRGVPVEWLGKQFIIEAEEFKKRNPRAYRNVYLGEVTGTGDSVFENVELDAITDEQIEQFEYIYRGGDWGYYPDPFAWNAMAYDSRSMTLYVFDEIHEHRKSNRETAQLILDRNIREQFPNVMDSAEPKSIGDYKEHGVWATGVHKWAGAVDYTMKWLQSLNKVVIDPKRAPHTAKEFTQYEYERTKNGELMTAYPDKNNHHIDAVRYGTYPIWRQRGQ